MKKTLSVILSVILIMTFAVTSLGLTSIAVKSINLNSSNINLQVGKTYTLKVTIAPADATIQKLTYLSVNKNIATVDKNGKIKGIKVGKTVITVTSSSNRKAAAKCKVTISQFAVPVVDISPITFTQFINISWIPDDRLNNETNQTLQYLTKLTGVKFKMSKVLVNDNSKLTLMLASGEDLPDIISTDIKDMNISRMIEGKKVFCINTLINEYAPEMNKQIEPEYFQYHKYIDGKNYYFTNFIVTDFVKSNLDYLLVDGSTGVNFIRSDVYDAIGKPDMTTPDSFFNALMTIKNKYPDMDAYYAGFYDAARNFFKVADTKQNIFFLSQFGLSKYDVTDGKVTSVIRNPKFSDMIKFMNKLNVNKLFAPEAFIDKQDQYRDKLQRGTAAVYAGSVGEIDTYGPRDNPNVKYVNLPYFKGATYSKSSSGMTATLISKNCTNPERLMQFLSYITTLEGRYTAAFGVKGSSWFIDSNTGKAKYTDAYAALNWNTKRTPQETTTMLNYGRNAFIWLADQYYSSRANTRWTPNDQARSALYKPQYKGDIYLGLMDPIAASPELTAFNKCSELTDTYYPKMVLASSEAAAVSVYNEYLQKCIDAGLAEVEAYWTAKYKQFSK